MEKRTKHIITAREKNLNRFLSKPVTIHLSLGVISVKVTGLLQRKEVWNDWFYYVDSEGGFVWFTAKTTYDPSVYSENEVSIHLMVLPTVSFP